MAAKRAAAAAFRPPVQGREWAVRFGDGAPLMRKCCDRSNGGSEPILHDAAPCTNDRSTTHIQKNASRSLRIAKDFEQTCSTLRLFLNGHNADQLTAKDFDRRVSRTNAKMKYWGVCTCLSSKSARSCSITMSPATNRGTLKDARPYTQGMQKCTHHLDHLQLGGRP